MSKLEQLLNEQRELAEGNFDRTYADSLSAKIQKLLVKGGHKGSVYSNTGRDGRMKLTVVSNAEDVYNLLLPLKKEGWKASKQRYMVDGWIYYFDKDGYAIEIGQDVGTDLVHIFGGQND